MSKRVVHVINGLAVAGAEMMLCKLLSRMDRARFEPVVVSLSGHGPLRQRIIDLDVPVHCIGLRLDRGLLAAVWRFRHVVHNMSADLIQGWQYHGNLAATLAQAWFAPRVPVLWNIRHSIYGLHNEKRLTAATVRLGARFSHRPAHIIYAAHACALQHEALGYRADKRVVLPNGFDGERFAPAADARLRLRQELGLAPSTLIIGKIARYHRVKDHANFLHAAALLARSHPTVHFLLAGENVDRANAELVNLVGSSNLAERTHLLGHRDDVHRVIAGLDIVTSASSGEAFPNVLGEAMACGVPCVATDVGDSALIVGDLGRVVPPRQPRALSSAWANLIELGRDARVALGATARRRILELYSLTSVVAQYEELYDSLDNRPQQQASHLRASTCVESPES